MGRALQVGSSSDSDPSPTPVGDGDGDGDGERAHKNSLRALYLGLPVAMVVWAAWSLFVGTSSSGGNPRVTGWRAVLYDLPSWLFILGVVATSMVFAAKALRARARGARWGLWLSSGVLMLALLVMATNIADTTSTPSSASLNWVVRAAMVPIAAGAMFLARRWSHTRAS